MQAGYAARGFIYFLVGGLALLAAFASGEAEGTTSALATLHAWPFGEPLLWAIAGGLQAYMVWRLIAAWADVEDHGLGPKGVVARASMAATGLLHGIVGLSVAGLAKGGAAEGEAAEDWTATLMQMPQGHWIVLAAGLILGAAGLYYIHKGVTASYTDHIKATCWTKRLRPMMTFGLMTYGACLVGVAASFVTAALTLDAQQATGLGQALGALNAQPYGWALLGIAGLGLLGFSTYNFVETFGRIVPKVTGTDMTPLSDA